MTKQPKKQVPTATITVRMPVALIAQLERNAAAAQMSRSAYAEALLGAHEPELCPSLAALGRVIAIHSIIVAAETVTAEQVRELKLLVIRLSKAAHLEADSLL